MNMIKWNIEGVRITQLRVIDSLLRTRNVSQTAAEMSLTQSAISKTLNSLRATFDNELFIKTASGMEPTALANLLASEVTDVLTSVANITQIQNCFDPSTVDQSFMVAGSDFFQSVLLMRVLPSIWQIAPKLSVHFSPFDSDRAVDQLARGEVSVVIGTLENAPESVSTKLFCEDHLVLAFGDSHPLASHDAVTIDQIAKTSLVSIASELTVNNQVKKQLEKAGISCRYPVTLASFGPLALLLSRGQFACVVPSRYVTAHKQAFALQARALPFTLPQLKMNINWHRRNHGDPLTQWMLAQFQTSFEVTTEGG